ncbi:DUF3052 domain-containing protein [Lacihabitans sp. CCS-44]|uniref:DUF3052 domain-containing protein n=1 Tax=Lacihabitans sp. CCS-44 TaxID=2487331 RepID=UPI0020CE8BA8|nr:DUF3052 domain-containing protein [Lacihabitans sp. CCS-44]MCP9755218.1 DUF3052 domain-containing protein [Lacihabitans sp. CCS-44]
MPNPLFKKLGLKDGQKVILVNIPENYFDLLIEVPEVEEAEDEQLADFLHIFESKLSELEKSFKMNVSRLKPDGMIWISWPKKTSKVATDVDYHSAKLIATQNGYVDVKVSAIDETWTACKYIIPIKNRL